MWHFQVYMYIFLVRTATSEGPPGQQLVYRSRCANQRFPTTPPVFSYDSQPPTFRPRFLPPTLLRLLCSVCSKSTRTIPPPSTLHTVQTTSSNSPTKCAVDQIENIHDICRTTQDEKERSVYLWMALCVCVFICLPATDWNWFAWETWAIIWHLVSLSQNIYMSG